MSFRFTVEIDRRKLVLAEVQTRFDDLEDFVNVTQFDPENVEVEAVDYRLTAEPLKINLMTRPAYFDLGALVAGWYPVNNHMLEHISTHANAPNVDGQSIYPSVLVRGVASFVGACRLTPLTMVCLGVRFSGAFPWTPLDGVAGVDTRRTLGRGRGDARPYYNPRQPQPHYMQQLVANWTPPDYPTDALVEVVAHFGGTLNSHRNPTQVGQYCLMVNDVLADDIQGWGWLELDARERGF